MKDSLTKKQIAKIVGIMLLAVLVIGVSVFGTFTTLYNASSSETTMSVENIPERIINIENDIASPQISLSSSEAFSTSDTGNSILKTITATVLPEDAPDKSVDWNISWITPIYDDAVVTDYVTVTPDSDGSTTATVTCYKGFEGASIRVTATTRVGGFTASCVVTYEGKPTEMVLESSGTEYEMVSLFNLSAGTTTSFNINLDNKLNAVGSKFGNFEIVSITGVGRFVAEKQYIVNGSVSSTEDVTLDLGSPTFTYQDDSKVVDREIDGKTMAERVNSTERRYDVVGVELLTRGNTNATDYGVGGSYRYSGYAQGYGDFDESTLNCVVEDFETLSLEVHHTYYRTNVSSLGKGHYNAVNTVYFSIPDRIFTQYGNLQKIHAEWWEYKTKMALVLNDESFVNLALKYTGKEVKNYNTDGDYLTRLYDQNIPFGVYSNLQTDFGDATASYSWTFNIDLQDGWKAGGVGKAWKKYCDNISSILPLVFYSPASDMDSLFSFLYSTVVKRNFDKTNNRYNFDTKPLSVAKRVAKIIYLPTKKWIVEFCDFLKRNKVYYVVWADVWAYNFNLITIVLEFLAFYFYFVVSFDFLSIYTQVYKLCLDLWTMFHYVPWCLWIILALCCFNRMRKAIAFNVLNHNEMKNRGFINERPIVFMACGSMGKNKTTFITDVALSQEVMFRDKAFEKILENDLKFPYFPWINLENAIKTAMEYHQVYNLATVRAYVQKKYCRFQKSPKRENIFDYDYVRYGLTYNNNLVVADVWDVIETYAQLYFIYVIESSLLVSNYSVRVDGLLQDLGNFPLWNSDFFKSDSRLIDSYSRHAHILDFDALRLGRKMIENNPNRDNFEFGVVLITEVGKERGNSIELVEKKKNDKGTNQKNDLFNSWLKMVRHSATVDNFPFVRVICDEQRPESWGADARDLCEIVYIKECSAPKLAMPFFNLAEIIHDSIFGRFKHLYSDYRYRRGDNSLIMYAIKSVFAKAHSYYERIHNLFDYKVLSLQVESGTMDGQIKDCKYYLSSKKIYSKRFSTDCFSDYFTQKAMRSAVGIDDMFEYASEKATSDELSEQNSYFVTELLQGINKEK